MYFAFLTGCNKVIPKLIYVSKDLDQLLSKISGVNKSLLVEEDGYDYEGIIYHCQINKKTWKRLYGNFHYGETCQFDLYILEDDKSIIKFEKIYDLFAEMTC